MAAPDPSLPVKKPFGTAVPRPAGPEQTARAREIQLATKVACVAVTICWLIAFPLGTSLADRAATGTFSLRLGYDFAMALWMGLSVLVIWLAGRALSFAVRVEAAAERLSSGYADGSRGTAARQQVSALNSEIDRALDRLAEAERLIRQQVRAIDTAGGALESGTISSAEKLQEERRTLMGLTEEMHREAERVAEKIAQRSREAVAGQASFETRLTEKSRELDGQLKRLEEVSTQSFSRFEALARSLETRGGDEADTPEQRAITDQLARNTHAIQAAQDEIAAQSKRIEELLREQRHRADRLAQVVTERASGRGNGPADRLTDQDDPAKLDAPDPDEYPSDPDIEADNDEGTASRREPAADVETKTGKAGNAGRREFAWKELLASVEGTVRGEPSERAPSPQNDDAAVRPATTTSAQPTVAEAEEAEDVAGRHLQQPTPATRSKAGTGIRTGPTTVPQIERLVIRIQNYSLALQTQLFGSPAHDELDRFEEGERQIFARAIIARDADATRAAIAGEIQTNPVFRERTDEFLKDFDSLLEPLAADPSGDETIASYLAAPIGKLYILVGSAAGHFS